MHEKLIDFNRAQRKGAVDLRAGDVVAVHRRITEGNKERIQVFEGMILAVKGGQSSSPMITVRKVSGGVGVEIIVPVFSPQIEKIELIKRAKVRRAKLYYTREKPAKKLRFKFTDAAEVRQKQQKTEKESPEVKGDDLTKIEGIGPQIAEVLRTAGVDTYRKLSETESEKIAEIIQDVPGNHNPGTWPEQAALAADGQWEELDRRQQELRGGVEEK